MDTQTQASVEGKGRPEKYLLKDGTQVPGVTTILRETESKDALVAWAVRLALSGKDHDKERDTAANIGKASHEAIHALVCGRGRPDVLPDVKDKVDEAVVKFEKWLDLRKPQIVLAEDPMVSEIHRFGGTPDLVCNLSGAYPTMGGHVDLEGKLVMVDYKTSNTGPYESWLMQLGGYALLFDEVHGRMPDAGLAVHVSARRKQYQETWITTGRLHYAAQAFLAFHRARRMRNDIGSWLKKGK